MFQEQESLEMVMLLREAFSEEERDNLFQVLSLQFTYFSYLHCMQTQGHLRLLYKKTKPLVQSHPIHFQPRSAGSASPALNGGAFRGQVEVRNMDDRLSRERKHNEERQQSGKVWSRQGSMYTREEGG